jgi:hypothetical protein
VSAEANRAVLVAILEKTKGETVDKCTIKTSIRVTNELLDVLTESLKAEGLISLNEKLFGASPIQRLGIAIRAVKLGANIGRVCRALGWLEFEEMTAHVFEANGFKVHRRYRFTAEGRRWELDLLSIRYPLVICTECKHWSRGIGETAVRKIVETHIEKVKIFSEKIKRTPGKLGFEGWGQGVVVPMMLSLQPTTLRFHDNVPVVSIMELPSFLSEFEGYLEQIANFKIELPFARS